MKITPKKEIIYGNCPATIYDIDDTIRSDTIMDAIELFETETVKMSSCYVSGYSDSGSCSGCTYSGKEDFKRLNEWSNPCLTYLVSFVDTQTGEYCFNMKASTNSMELLILVNPQLKGKVL